MELKIRYSFALVALLLTLFFLYITIKINNKFRLHHVFINDTFTDGFMVLSRDYLLLDYNKTLETIFQGILVLNKNTKILLQFENFVSNPLIFEQIIEKAIAEKRTIAYEKIIALGERSFSIEFTPVYLKNKPTAIIILFKDNTEHQNYIATLKSKNRELDEINYELQLQNEKIEELNRELKNMADLDGLTSAYNRRFFNEYYAIEVERMLNFKLRQSQNNMTINFGIAILDIDNFKSINDTYGHLVGDDVLKGIVSLIKKTIFSRDFVCRYGGEEFAVIFTNTDRLGIIQAAEKIREEIEDCPFFYEQSSKKLEITVSIGLAFFNEDYGIMKKDLLKVADERLYRAKRTGKNKVVYA